MTWFKVDDSFAFHPKAMAAGNAALGLWVRAGSWAAQQLTDGRIPSGLLQTLGGKPRDARRLVDVGLWLEVDGGWLFHDWDEFQPSRQVVQGKRADARERMKRVRAERRSREQPANVRENFAECSPYPDPTRPEENETADAVSAPRRRARPSATPSTDLALVPDDPPTTAQTLVATWIDHCRARPPSNVIGQIAKHCAALLAEGIDPDAIEAGLAAWHSKGLHPSTLPSVVNEVLNPPTATNGTAHSRERQRMFNRWDEIAAAATARGL